ncbi:MAG: efflux RND transporter periplasmic adaptor subunit, partial [Actinomycetota bacterium]
VKYRQIQAGIAQGAAYRPPPEAVTTIVAQEDQWHHTLSAIGTVTAVHGVMVSADLPGIIERTAIDSGRPVNEGDLLVQLDTKQEVAQQASAEARRDLALANRERIRGLLDRKVASAAEFDAAEAEARQAEAAVQEIRATIERKTIRAPFSGILGIRQVDRGQYLDGGDPVVPLQALDPVYVDFAVPQQEVGRLRVGGEVTVSLQDSTGESRRSSARITAIDSLVNDATRNVMVQATAANPGRLLRPGMFVEVELVFDQSETVVPLPASSISYAPYGDSVFIVEEMPGPDGAAYSGVRQQFVKLGPSRGDQIAVLSGVEPGQEVVTSGTFKLRSGAAVLVNNEIQPGNDPSPAPEDR